MLPSTRRQFIFSALGFSGLTGCTSVLSEPPSDGIILAYVDLRNYSEEPRVFDLLIEIEDEVVHWDTHKVPDPYTGPEYERESVLVDMDAPGAVTLRARIEDQQSNIDFTRDSSGTDFTGDCVIGVVSYDQQDKGTLRTYPQETSKENCSTPTEGI